MSFSYIHDPDFETDFEDNYGEEQMTFGERLSGLNEEYMNINKMEEDYVFALIRDLFDLFDDSEEEMDLFYMREHLSCVQEFGNSCWKRVLEKDKDFFDTCMCRAVLSLELIDNMDESDYYMWENTANTIMDFLDIAHNM